MFDMDIFDSVDAAHELAEGLQSAVSYLVAARRVSSLHTSPVPIADLLEKAFDQVTRSATAFHRLRKDVSSTQLSVQIVMDTFHVVGRQQDKSCEQERLLKQVRKLRWIGQSKEAEELLRTVAFHSVGARNHARPRT